jgi:hypothetical protein
MAQTIEYIGNPGKVGCMDPAANNYDPFANIPCFGCCDYGGPVVVGCTDPLANNYNPNGGPVVVGCTDPLANNYNPNATEQCDNCCEYGGGPVLPELPQGPVVFNPGGFGGQPSTPSGDDPCANLVLAVTSDNNPLGAGIVIDGNGNPISETCCTRDIVGTPVTWDTNILQQEGEGKGFCRILSEETNPQDGGLCSLTDSELESRVICIDCDTFTWWDNLYTSVNGSSLQETDPSLWLYLVNVVENEPPFNTGGSFYVDNLTGEIIQSSVCCDRLEPESLFIDELDENGDPIRVCLCDLLPPEPLTSCECVNTIEQFVQYVSTKVGSSILLTNDILIPLGLTQEEANFIIDNFNSTDDNDGNGIVDSIDARTLLANALFTSGGFYLCFELDSEGNVQYNKPVATDEAKCEELNGEWTGTSCLCERQETCDLNITDLQLTVSTDLLGNTVEVITFNGEDISEICCDRISSENNLGWVYTEGLDGVARCYRTEPKECPVQIQLNETPITVNCPNPVEITASLYFSSPENPCQPIEEDDDGVIVPDEGSPCILTFDENGNLTESNDTNPQIINNVRPI